MSKVDLSSMPIGIHFVPVNPDTGDQITEPTSPFPIYTGAHAAPQIGHTISLPGGPWKVRSVIWHYPLDQESVERRGVQLVSVHIYSLAEDASDNDDE